MRWCVAVSIMKLCKITNVLNLDKKYFEKNTISKLRYYHTLLFCCLKNKKAMALNINKLGALIRKYLVTGVCKEG